jgi:hypothetical protein
MSRVDGALQEQRGPEKEAPLLRRSSGCCVVDRAPTFTLGTLVVSNVKHHITVAASRSELTKTSWPWVAAVAPRQWPCMDG